MNRKESKNMDVKRAIEWQKAFKKTYNGMPEEVIDACSTAIDALEKQIPQKPIQNEKFYACPSCGVIRSIRQKHDYCQKCGQAFDWTEGSEDE